MPLQDRLQVLEDNVHAGKLTRSNPLLPLRNTGLPPSISRNFNVNPSSYCSSELPRILLHQIIISDTLFKSDPLLSLHLCVQPPAPITRFHLLGYYLPRWRAFPKSMPTVDLPTYTTASLHLTGLSFYTLHTTALICSGSTCTSRSTRLTPLISSAARLRSPPDSHYRTRSMDWAWVPGLDIFRNLNVR